MTIDYIAGERFADLPKTTGLKNLVYCKIDDANELLKNPPSHDFVLITHNGDGNITSNPTRQFDADSRLMPPNLKMWFGQNVCVEHERIVSIPIGLENSQWFANIGKRQFLTNIQTRAWAPRLINCVYANFNIATNPCERRYAFDCVNGKNWCTVEMKNNGDDYENYVENLWKHDFVMCPDGNGVDTHRLWETLYVGSIPVVKMGVNTKFYLDLPIMFVNDWNEIEQFLPRVSPNSFKTYNEWNYEKLTFKYWQDLIVKTCKSI